MDLPSPGLSILVHLPLELYSLTCSFLLNRDIKSLRLTNRTVESRTPLRLSRVFISASPRDIAVLRSVADHEHYRRGVKEIVWDDAVLADDPGLRYNYPDPQYECPRWFVRACNDNNYKLQGRYQYDCRVQPDQMIAAQLPLKESWAYFEEWRNQQDESIAANADVAAFTYALQRFPALHSVQVTPVAHGHTLGFPLYETPAIRALPRGINYPLPHGWMATREADYPEYTPVWRDTDGNGRQDVDIEFTDEATVPWLWRGFRICLRELAKAAVCRQNQQPSSKREGECARLHSIVTDLSFDTHYFDAGINSRMFEQPCVAYDNLVTLLRQPGMRRFHLALAVGGQQYRHWQALRSGRLQRALAALGPDLEELTLGTNMQADDVHVPAFRNAAGDLMNNHVALETLFPPDIASRWPRLTTLHLYGLLVTQVDLLGLLAALPTSVRRIVLGDLTLADGYTPWPTSRPGKNWRLVMYAMRDTLGWRQRPEGERPHVVIWQMRYLENRRPGRTTWADAAVDAFLYGDGVCPYGGDMGDHTSPNEFTSKVATEIRDSADPGFNRPNVDLMELVRLGYAKKDPFLFPTSMLG